MTKKIGFQNLLDLKIEGKKYFAPKNPDWADENKGKVYLFRGDNDA